MPALSRNRAEYRIDPAKVQRMLKAFDYGVEPEHMMERFGVNRHVLYVVLRRNGREFAKNNVTC